MQDLIAQHFEQYLRYLRELVKRPSPFENPGKVREAMSYCKEVFDENLENYQIYYDAENNLIAIPNKIQRSEELTYLSAHIDTVGADPDAWDEPFNPWKPYEDDKQIVARGVNDCKAGVAYQLFISYLISKGLIEARNLCFAITFKEEGAGNKSAQEIGKQMGGDLPLSDKATYFLVLENNVYVGARPKLCIYLSERSNYVVKVKGSIEELKELLIRLPAWNPVAITPNQPFVDGELSKQKGGHICSLKPEDNLLRRAILNASQSDLIHSGEAANFATIPTEIHVKRQQDPKLHTLIINNRSFDNLEEVERQLEGVKYEQVKDFSVSQGFNVEEQFADSAMADAFQNCIANAELDIKYTYNIGASDGTIVYGSMNPERKPKFYPVVAGPGCRSQRELDPPRLTHGRNETFDKESGRKVLGFLTSILLSSQTKY